MVLALLAQHWWRTLINHAFRPDALHGLMIPVAHRSTNKKLMPWKLEHITIEPATAWKHREDLPHPESGPWNRQCPFLKIKSQSILYPRIIFGLRLASWLLVLVGTYCRHTYTETRSHVDCFSMIVSKGSRPGYIALTEITVTKQTL